MINIKAKIIIEVNLNLESLAHYNDVNLDKLLSSITDKNADMYGLMEYPDIDYMLEEVRGYHSHRVIPPDMDTEKAIVVEEENVELLSNLS